MADCIDLGEVALVVWSFIDKSAAAEYLDVVYKTFQKCIVGPALNVSVVTEATVRPYYLWECVLEPLWETIRLCCKLYDMHEVAELCCTVTEPLCTEAEFRIDGLDMVTDLSESLSLIAACIKVLYREFA